MIVPGVKRKAKTMVLKEQLCLYHVGSKNPTIIA